MNRQKYSKVDKSEVEDMQRPPRVVDSSVKWTDVRSKIEAAIWVVVFFVVFEKTRIFKEMFTNPKINQLFMTIFMMAFGINFSIVIFVALVIPYCGYERYEDYSPQITPFASVIMAVGFLSCIVAVYPVYGLWSILLVPVLGMGFLMISQFIPFKGNLNSLVLFLIFSVLLAYGYYFH